MSRLVAMVPRNRRACGRLALFARDGRMLFGPVRILATANKRIAVRKNNPKRNPRLPFGNPPSGSYLVLGTLPPGYVNPRRPRRFGTTGALLLKPQAGVTLTAFANGRRLFYLHGGPPDDRGRLRPTRGGLRVSDVDMTSLLDAINRAFAAGDSVSSLDLVDVPAPSTQSGDRIGKGRPFLPPPKGATVAPPKPKIGLTHAALIVGGAGLLEPRGGQAPPKDPVRRRFLAGALLLLVGLGAAGCTGENDAPSPCAPVPCDPVDSWCPPGGYVCPSDVGGGADLGSGGTVDVGGGGTNGGSNDATDTSGGSG